MLVDRLGNHKHTNLLLIVAGFLSLFVIAALVWTSLNHVLYAGTDGRLFQHLFSSEFRYTSPFDTSSINILQGAGALYSPLSIWANPGYLIFGLLDPQWARVISACYFVGVYCLATFALARTIGVGIVPAIIAGQAAMLAFPPFQIEAGLDILFVLNPGFSYSFSLLTFALCFLIRTTSLSNVVPNALAITLLFSYSVACDPGWTILSSISLGVAVAVYVVCSRSSRTLFSRALVLAAVCLIVYLAGVWDYLVTLASYTSRIYFRPEMHGETQSLFNVSILFQSRAALLTYWILACGWLFAVIFTKGRQRLLAAVCILYALCLLVLGIAYLLFDIVWTLPLPRYFEQSVYHIFILGAAIGWFALLAEYRTLLFAAIKTVKAFRLTSAPVFTWPAVLTVPVIVFYYLIGVAPYRHGIYVEPPVPDTGFMSYLRSSIGMAPGENFRGSVSLPFGDSAKTSTSYKTYFDKSWIPLLIGLWEADIPTLEVYGTVSPPLFYFTSRLLSRPDDYFWRNGFTVTKLSLSILQAVGVRYVIYPLPIDSSGVVLRQQSHASGQDFTWYLYELAAPNVGNFSPTRVHAAGNARQIIEMMQAPNFDFRTDAVVMKELGRPLTAASRSSFSFDRGSVRVRGMSDGDSLLVLPIQFSNCLKTSRGSQIELIRVNLMLTGVLFHREVDARIDLGHGVFSPGCRRTDLQELHALQMEPDRKVVQAPDHWPHVIIKLEDLRRQARDIFGQIP